MTKAVLWTTNNGGVAVDVAFVNNFTASAAPTSTDDNSKGYTPGSTWIYDGVVYTNTSATIGAATWAAGGGPTYPVQGNPVAKTSSGTLTAADILAGIITVNPGGGGNSAQVLPTGAQVQAALPSTFAANNYFEFSIINLSGVTGETVTIMSNTGMSVVGGPLIAIGMSTIFRVRKTANNTFIAYNIAG